MLRRLTLSLVVLLCLGIIIPSVPVFNFVLGPVVSVEPAQAQEKKKRKSLFDTLFKRRKKEKKKVKIINSKKKKKTTRSLRKAKKKTKKARNTASNSKKRKTKRKIVKKAKPAVITVKNENAAKVLVLGDFLAGGMAKELQKLYASNANVVIVSKTDPASGIVRDDVINWPDTLPALIDEFKPIAVVNLVGMNDRQKLWKFPGQPAKLSPEWLAEYNKRVSSITKITASNKIPLVWVGLPPVRSAKMNADYLAFNEIYRTKIEETGGGEYVDIWDGFTNEEGKFVSAGPDINGQIVRLRGSKGINMTRSGRAKLAFFADKALRKIGVIGNAEGFEFANLGTINLNAAQPNTPEYNPIKTGKTNVISLGSPSLDGGSTLEGGEENTASIKGENSVSYDLVEKGQNILPKIGRIDSIWGKPNELEIVKPEEIKDEKTKNNLNLSNRFAPLPTLTNAPSPQPAAVN